MSIKTKKPAAKKRQPLTEDQIKELYKSSRKYLLREEAEARLFNSIRNMVTYRNASWLLDKHQDIIDKTTERMTDRFLNEVKQTVRGPVNAAWDNAVQRESGYYIAACSAEYILAHLEDIIEDVPAWCKLKQLFMNPLIEDEQFIEEQVTQERILGTSFPISKDAYDHLYRTLCNERPATLLGFCQDYIPDKKDRTDDCAEVRKTHIQIETALNKALEAIQHMSPDTDEYVDKFLHQLLRNKSDFIPSYITQLITNTITAAWWRSEHNDSELTESEKTDEILEQVEAQLKMMHIDVCIPTVNERGIPCWKANRIACRGMCPHD